MRVKTSSRAATTPTRLNEPNSEKSPSRDRSGVRTTPSGRAGTLSDQPPGLAPSGVLGPTSKTASTTAATTVVATMPSRIAPRVRRATSTAVSSSPTTKTRVGQPRSWPVAPSWTGTVVPAASGMRRTKPASTSPMKAMNSPMPTLIAVLSSPGMAWKTAVRKPVSTSSVMTRPSSTTRPMASAQLISDAIEKVTKTFSPRPVASANG